MLQAAASFGAGVVAMRGLEACQQATSDCAVNTSCESEDTAFKIAVHVHAASAPGLQEPGLVARPRLRLHVLLGAMQKETEAADFSRAEPASGSQPRARGGQGGAADAELSGCPWRFGDTLTFAAQLSDVLHARLRLRLCARSLVCVGPLQMQLPGMQDCGEAWLDLRRRVLLACEPGGASGTFGGSGRPAWTSPVQLVPLVRTGDAAEGGAEVAPAGRVAVSFTVNANPAALLREAARSEKPLMEKVVDPVIHCVSEPTACLPSCEHTSAVGGPPPGWDDQAFEEGQDAEDEGQGAGGSQHGRALPADLSILAAPTPLSGARPDHGAAAGKLAVHSGPHLNGLRPPHPSSNRHGQAEGRPHRKYVWCHG